MENKYDSFYCPITGEVMQDPVILPDGFSYERTAIEEWLKKNGESPMTRQKFTVADLIPNRALQEQIRSVPQSELQQISKPQVFNQKAFNESTEAKELTLETTLDDKGLVRFSIGIEDVQECPPVDVVTVVDISGSMGDTCAGVTDGRTKYIENGFSLLDLVKHAMKTVTKTLRPQDRMALLQFDDQVDVCFGFSEMNEIGQNIGFKAIEQMEGRNSTNIYNALVEAIKIVDARDNTQRNPSILFFTDGVPNVSPAKGEVEALKKIQEQKKFTCPIHTYGFGQYKRLNSQLLYDISKVFRGMNGYIPDPTNIGTIFVNALSNILTTAAIDVKLHVNVENIREDIQKLYVGEFTNEISEDGILTIDIGSVRFGQTIDVLIQFDPMRVNQYNFAQHWITYESNGKKLQTDGRTMLKKGSNTDNLSHILRFETINLISHFIETFQQDFESCQPMLQQHIQKWEDQQLTDQVSVGIIQNLKDQITLALQKKKYFMKWGTHQCRQLIRSLNLQVKNNFRDPALANFGGQLFKNFAETADDIYNNLPPPKPSRLNQVNEVKLQAAPVIQSAQDFAEVYNNVNCGAGCFSGKSTIQMQDGSVKLVENLVKGDIVKTPNGSAKIVCVLNIKTGGRIKMCQLEGGLQITPHHPVQVSGEWKLPSDLQKTEIINCETVYDLVVDRDHIAIINGINVILLGHNYQQELLKHDYLGTAEVIRDLEKMPGWNSGSISLKNGCFVKQNGVRSKVIYNGE